MQELIAAAKRQVHVTLIVDAHCLMMHDNTALPTGPLYTRPDSIPRGYGRFRAKTLLLNELRDSGGEYHNQCCIRYNVNLTTTQVETLFGELEYIDPRLKVLGGVKEQNARAIDNTSYSS
jgi:hypothetical protein